MEVHNHLYVSLREATSKLVIGERGKNLIGVKFPRSRNDGHSTYSSTTYDYWSDDDTIQEGDFAVVQTPGGLTVVRVVSVKHDIFTGTHVTGKWIVQKIDLSGAEKRDQKIQLVNQLRERFQEEVTKAKRTVEMRDLVKANPALQEILDAFSELGIPLVVEK